jgi:hypothetical protein
VTAQALGRAWVRQRANRLVALYNGFPQLVAGDESAGIPPKREAELAIAALRETAERIHRWEQTRSGAPRLSAYRTNEVLRDWADLEKTWRWTAERLKAG